MGSLVPVRAPFFSDVVLVFELCIGVALLAGMFLVRAGHVRAHMYLQASMVLVNIPVVLVWMLPLYLEYTLPGIPARLGELTYLVPTLMLVFGVLAESLGVYILLVAGTTLLPERLRFRRYKLVMRTELGLWWSVLIAGITTYYLLFVMT